jgi:transketolase
LRNAFAKALYECAVNDERIYILAADISPAGPLVQFAKDFPRRFINVGVAEQAMIGMAAGLALKGMRPFCYTIATFALYRPFEFIRNDLAYQNLPVTVVGMGAGLNYSTLGATHHAIEDVAVASCIPGMTVLAPCDPLETEQAVWHCAESTGPIYLRLGKAGEPVLTRPYSWNHRMLNWIRDVDRSLCILSYGPTVGTALQVADVIGGSVASCHSLKPLDEAGIEYCLEVFPRVIVIEEHVKQGGLGQQVRAMANRWAQVDTFSLKDEFIHYHGKRDYLLGLHGLTPLQIVAKLGEKRDIPRHNTGG